MWNQIAVGRQDKHSWIVGIWDLGPIFQDNLSCSEHREMVINIVVVIVIFVVVVLYVMSAVISCLLLRKTLVLATKNTQNTAVSLKAGVGHVYFEKDSWTIGGSKWHKLLKFLWMIIGFH